jgi:hypothetical protein
MKLWCFLGWSSWRVLGFAWRPDPWRMLRLAVVLRGNTRKETEQQASHPRAANRKWSQIKVIATSTRL